MNIDFSVVFYNLKAAVCELLVASCNFKEKNYELRVPFHKL